MTDKDDKQICKAIAVIIARAWADPAFKDAIVAAGPHVRDVLPTYGLTLPEIPGYEDASIVFVSNSKETRYIVIPDTPELADEDVGHFVKSRQLQTVCTDCRTSNNPPTT